MEQTIKAFISYKQNKVKNTYTSILTTDENEAKAFSPEYELASIHDLADEISVGVIFTDIIIQIKEGYCKWYSLTEQYDSDESIFYGYELITEYIPSEPAA